MVIPVVVLVAALQVLPATPTPSPTPIHYTECRYCHEVVRSECQPGQGPCKLKGHQFILIRTGERTGYETCLQAVINAFKRLGVGRDIELAPPTEEEKNK